MAISVLELVVASAGLLLTLIVIFIAMYLTQKTANKLRMMVLLILISLIPTGLYMIGRMLNIESAFTSGKLIGLILNLFTILFWLFAILALNSLVNGVSNSLNHNKTTQRNKIRKVNKGIEIRNLVKKR